MRTHRLFALNLASGFPFATRLAAAEGPADVTFSASSQPPVAGDWKETQPVFRSPRRTEDGESISRLHRMDDCEVLRFPRVADFFLRSGEIACHLLAPDHQALVEIRLLGPVFSYWLERRGLPTLHASAVDVDGRAVAFLSSNGGGKTGLAAAMMRAGCPLLTDDVLPLEDREGVFFGRPGYPQMRMWPDEAAWFLGKAEDLALVHPAFAKRRVPVGPGGLGAFQGSTLPLASLFVPERRPDGPVEIRDVPPREAFLELVRHSFSPHLVQAAGLQAGRADLFARLVGRVPMRRLLYPSGFERLPEVAEEIPRLAR